MDKKLKIRLIIAIAAVFAAALVVALSTGIVDYWTKGIKFYVDGGYRIMVSTLVSEDEIIIKNGETAKLSVGEMTVINVEVINGGSTVTVELKSELAYGGAKVISAKPLGGTKKTVMRAEYTWHELELETQTVEKDKIVAIYKCDVELPKDAEFGFSNVILNEFSRD